LRSIDLDLRKALEFRPERGELLLDGDRMTLLNRHALRSLYERLYHELGDEMTRAFLMQVGYRWGIGDYQTLAAAHEWDSEQDKLTAGPVTQMWQGIVHSEATTVDFDRAIGRFVVKGIWRNSYEVDLHRELRPEHQGDNCMCLCGYASGWASAFFERPVLAIETTCVSQGAPHCTFEIRTDAAWGSDAGRWRSALVMDARTVTGELQLQLDACRRELGEVKQRLASASATADAALEGRTAFVASLSHGLRTPAAAIIGLAESLGKSGLNAAQRRSLNLLRDSAETLVAIVKDTLDLSTIEAGQVELAQAPLDLRQVIDGAAALAEPRAREKGLTFFVTAQDGVAPVILGDAERLRDVIVHLCTNAVRSTDAGAVVVTLKVPEPGADGRDRHAIEITDTGAGIAPEELAILFEARPRGESEAASGPRWGSGLALVVCRRLAQLMGGDIEVDSQVGAGSTFRFSFTAARPETSAGDGVASAGGGGGQAAGPLRVLIVEDNPVLLFLLREQLGGLGYHPIATSGGADALVEIERQPIDLVFTDLHMPGMDGFELNRELRARTLARQPYVIALTADGTARQRARCLAEGIDDFAMKPLSHEGLVELMDRATAARGAARPLSGGDGAAGTPEGSAVDEHALLALRTNLGSSELLGDLIGTFIRDANELLALFGSDDGVEARRAAHSLKSTSLAVGARSLAGIAAEAEKGDPAQAMPRARQELDRVELALRNIRL
jgi:signal transduction histidine kinase/HPt (histidine-containing phosphotransfer) domain-containing protein/ActR/RegA family two-component response regulator